MVDKPNRVLRHTRSTVEALARSGPLAPPDLARELGIPRPTAYRLLASLASENLVEQGPDGRFTPTTRWLQFGDAALRAASAWFHRDDVLEALREHTGLTVFLSVPRPGRTVCVRRLHGRSYNILVLRPGGSLPLHLGGVGRVTLAFGTGGEHAYLEQGPFAPATEFSLVTREQLVADVATSRADGSTLSDQDVTIGVAALAVPVVVRGDLRAALSVAGRREDIVDRVEQLRGLLVEAAERIGEDS